MMDNAEPGMTFPEIDSADSEHSYFGNPYQLDYEQYGLENLDRDIDDADDIERVVILGYN